MFSSHPFSGRPPPTYVECSTSPRGGPCILFLDEFDALARTRTDALEHNELRRAVNNLLLMMERFKGPGLVIAATNLQQSLDEALWRRFDDIIWFDLPTEREIAQLLSHQFANFPAHFDLARSEQQANRNVLCRHRAHLHRQSKKPS